MNKLPPDFDGKFFIGRKLELVSFWEYSVFFSFEKEANITVQSSLQHLFTQDIGDEKQVIPLSESRLMQLVGHTVTKVMTKSDGTLEFKFDDGQTLKIFDDLPNYESYSIKHGDDEIFV